jgi:hypothetical protein
MKIGAAGLWVADLLADELAGAIGGIIEEGIAIMKAILDGQSVHGSA